MSDDIVAELDRWLYLEKRELVQRARDEIVELREQIAGLAQSVVLTHAAARAEQRERDARMHEQISPASDEERIRGIPGAGAMGAIIEYRDAIRNQGDET